MKLTKRLAAIAACACMAATSVVSMGASAADSNISNSSAIETVSNISYENGDYAYSPSSLNVVSQIHALNSPFPHYQQPAGSNSCWIKCSRAIINYMLETNYSDEYMVTVANFLKDKYNIGDYVTLDSTASYETTSEVIRYCINQRGYGIVPAQIPLSDVDIKFCIDRDCPILMCVNSTNPYISAGHMMVITGYGTAVIDYPELGIYAGDITGLLYMDPLTGTEQFAEYYGSKSNYSIEICNSMTNNVPIQCVWTKSVITWRQ